MSTTPGDETEDELTAKYLYIINAGVLGASIVFLAAMLALPTSDIDTPLTIALVAFAITLPFSVLAALVVPGDLVPYINVPVVILTLIGMFSFFVGLAAIFFHLSFLAFSVFVGAAFIVFIIFVLFQLNMERLDKEQRERLPPKTASIQPRVVRSGGAGNGAQRPSHSNIVQSEMKYSRRPVKRSRTGNRSDTDVSRGSHQIPPED